MDDGLETLVEVKNTLKLWETIGQDAQAWKSDSETIRKNWKGFKPRFASIDAYRSDVAMRAGPWHPELGISALDTSDIDYFSMNMGRKFTVKGRSGVGDKTVTELKEVLFANGKETCDEVMDSLFTEIHGAPCTLGVNHHILALAAGKMGVAPENANSFVAENFDDRILIRKLIAEIEVAERRENDRQEAFLDFWKLKGNAFRMKYEKSLNVRYNAKGAHIKPITWKQILARISKIESALDAKTAPRAIFEKYLPLEKIETGDPRIDPFVLEMVGDEYIAYPNYTVPNYVPGSASSLQLSLDKRFGTYTVKNKTSANGFVDAPRELRAADALRFFCKYIRFIYNNLSDLTRDQMTAEPENALELYLLNPNKLRALNYAADSGMTDLIKELRQNATCLREMPDVALLLDASRVLLSLTLDTLADEQIVALDKMERSLRVTPITFTFVFFAALIGLFAYFRYTLIDQRIGQLALTALLGLILVFNIFVAAVSRRNRQYRRAYGEAKGSGRKWILSLAIVSVALLLTGCYFMARYDAYDDTYYYNRRADHTMVISGLYNTKATDLVIPETYEDYTVTGIAANSFLLPNSVVSVTLPATCTEVGALAFVGCDDLVTVDLSAAPVTLGKHAFEGCESLTTVILSEGTTTIPEYCFKNCVSLVEVYGATNVTTIEKSAFQGCTSLDVSLPAVNTVGNKAFKNTAMTSVSLEQYVSVGDYAFAECNGITDIAAVLSPELTLGTGAFSSCEGLVGVELTFAGSAVPEKLFKGCSSLSFVKIVGSVSEMGKGILYGCPVETLTLPYLGENAESHKEIGYFISSEGKKVLRTVKLMGGGEMVVVENGFKDCEVLTTLECNTITRVEKAGFKNCASFESISFDSIEYIGKEAFANTAITAYASGPVVTEIGKEAFAGCEYLTTVTISDPSVKLGKKVFADCPVLTDVRMASLGGSGNERTMEYVFGNTCAVITDVTLTGPISGEKSFVGCSALTSVKMSDLQTEIPEKCFKDCAMLTAVQAEGVTEVKAQAFMNCVSLTSISCNSVEIIGKEAYKGTSVATLQSGKIIDVGDEAFAETPLASIDLYNEELRLGKKVFDGCADLTVVRVGRLYRKEAPATLSSVMGSSIETVFSVMIGSQTELAEEVFAEAPALEIVTLNAPVETIPERAFYKCYFLSKLYAQGVKKIEDEAFYRCYALDRVPCETELESIGKKAFAESGVTSFRGGAALTTIGKGAFQDAEDMTYIDVSTCSELDLGKNAFADCDSLVDVKLYALGSGEKERTMKYIFADSRRTICSLQIEGTVSSKKCFADCESLTTMRLSDLQTEIPDGAFKGCSALESVVGLNVVTVGNSAFEGCTSFEHYTFGALTEIGRYAFCDTSLYSFVATDALKKIGKYALKNTFIESIIISASDAEIEKGAFAGCDWLTAVSLNSIGTEKSPKPLSYLLGDGVENVAYIHITNQTTMAKGAFKGAKNATQIIYDLPVTKIPKEAFKNCERLPSFAMESVEEIGASAFENCTSLTTAELPYSLAEIGKRAFKGCVSLTTIEIPLKVEHVEKKTFSGCTALREVTFGNGLKTIEKRAFEHCESLRTVTLNEGLEKIRKLAFFECTSLRIVYLPSTLKKIGCLAFFDYEDPLLVMYGGTQYNWEKLRKGMAFLGTEIEVNYDMFPSGVWEDTYKYLFTDEEEGSDTSELLLSARNYGTNAVLPEYYVSPSSWGSNVYCSTIDGGYYSCYTIDYEVYDDDLAAAFSDSFMLQLFDQGFDVVVSGSWGWEMIKGDTVIAFRQDDYYGGSHSFHYYVYTYSNLYYY